MCNRPFWFGYSQLQFRQNFYNAVEIEGTVHMQGVFLKHHF